MIFQLCNRDQYGTSTIIKTSDDISLAGLKQLVVDGKACVTEDNMNNALALDEKLKDFTSVFVEFIEGEEDLENVVYAGKRLGNKENLYIIDFQKDNEDVTVETKIVQDVEVEQRFFIGEIVSDTKNNIRQSYYLDKTDPANRKNKILIGDFNDSDLEGKTWYFINIIE